MGTAPWGLIRNQFNLDVGRSFSSAGMRHATGFVGSSGAGEDSVGAGVGGITISVASGAHCVSLCTF
jgi:hypothetical protein